MTFAELAPAPSDPPEPYTDRLRLVAAAYLARTLPMSERALCGVAWHRRTPVLLRRCQEVSP
jgi:hypothetical protein